ncbi:MAG TPA: nuclear transport factor 2 family protein [Methyloceanibacter sp.]|nr:nuclear transport factor 2 family protein [Methyloceanibacter sp.]
MRYLATAIIFAALSLGVSIPANADDVAAIEAIDNAAGELDEAFVKQDADAIKSLTTPDHVAVTHYYGEPTTVAEQIASLPELKYEQTNLTEPTVKLLGPDAAMRTFTAKLDGTFKGESLTARVFVTQIMQKLDGKWREKFYQVTALKQ